jgi:hypothetical protein
LFVPKEENRENDQRSHENPHLISPSPTSRTQVDDEPTVAFRAR